MKQTILIVEDDITFGTMLQKWFNRKGIEAVFCSGVAAAQNELDKTDFNLVITDLRLPDGDGIGLLHWMRECKLMTPVFIMTGYGEVSSAVAAIKLGAEDFLEKPINPSILYEKVEQVLSGKTETKPVVSEPPVVTGSVVNGTSAAFKTLQNHILKVAPTRMSVLILGESGTGKEYAARMIHDNSTRRCNPFIAVDCGSLSRELAPSELFGHLKGSFTSAVNDKTGVFEQANGGTVFLDEVGNLSYEVQMQLLRALQERKVRPVGAVKDIEVDVRILAATNENLENAIAQGRFREDLYYRLNEFSVMVPPLRDRREDIVLFAREFLRQANEELDRSVKDFAPSALDLMLKYQWNGNLRELRNVVRRVVLFADNEIIRPEDLPFNASDFLMPQLLQQGTEKEQIEAALERARGNKTLAAQMLQIDRKTLYNKIHHYGLKL